MRGALILAALMAPGVGQSSGSGEQELALAVAREWERLGSERVDWPGFDPLSIPLALFTGERTYLFRHPSPPDGFSPVADGPGAFVSEGRHPSVTSNSTAEIGGVLTATLLADGSRAERSPTDLAATALHEAFHVYQRARHPGWIGNEADLFLYPTDDARLLALRRLESEALRRALGGIDREGGACWARLALRYRRERFAAMEPAFPAYERLTELNEGLATYVQLVASGKSTVEVPTEEFSATAVRERIYSVGPALAFLLDRLRPGWKEALETDDSAHLDEMLDAALGTGECAFPAPEVDAVRRRAEEDGAAVAGKRRSRREAFDARPGWRLVVEAVDGTPLWPQGFDPLNVERVEGGLLHTRFLHLGNDAGELRVIDEEGADVEALTEALGPHPLFSGIRRVTVAGLEKPEIETEGARATLRVAGLMARFEKATVQVRGTEVLVRWELR